ncbi:PREDICTED: uncharacterized protein At4g26485-like [Ipomoea nil]|uniref:uncharacterized protein At4g26485-like n=1 Tax=Ipomoea nil TaxID=35883 RepID=UPI000901BF89|nr:PREDICTED: uncharacterized protein At4g26485-like [Ipomoea nil]
MVLAKINFGQRHQSLVRGYLKSAKEMICENGEIHITQRTDGGFDAWRIEFIASQLGLELEEAFSYFNFPHSGIFKSRGGRRHISQIRCNQALVREFLGNAKQLLGENGEIHITHKSNGFHLKWNIVSLAIEQGLELADCVDFDVSEYPGYSNKYGFGGDRSFDFLPCKTYMFRHPGKSILQICN